MLQLWWAALRCLCALLFFCVPFVFVFVVLLILMYLQSFCVSASTVFFVSAVSVLFKFSLHVQHAVGTVSTCLCTSRVLVHICMRYLWNHNSKQRGEHVSSTRHDGGCFGLLSSFCVSRVHVVLCMV